MIHADQITCAFEKEITLEAHVSFDLFFCFRIFYQHRVPIYLLLMFVDSFSCFTFLLLSV